MGGQTCAVSATAAGASVKLLIDAHLPRRMVYWFSQAGCDAIHTLDLPAGNRSTDQQISGIAQQDQRILITKDSDFVDTHLLWGVPPKLLLISTGNIRNSELESLLVPLIPELVSKFAEHSFIELGSSGIVLRN